MFDSILIVLMTSVSPITETFSLLEQITSFIVYIQVDFKVNITNSNIFDGSAVGYSFIMKCS